MNKVYKFVGIACTLVLVGIASFVGYNLIKDARVEKVEQSETPTVEEARAALEQQQTERAEVEGAEDVAVQAPLNQQLGEFVDSEDYEIEGSLSLVEVGGERFFKFSDDFVAERGPDLVVYLSPNLSGDDLGEFISLGDLKEGSGAQLYSVPENYEDFQSLHVWCRAFNGSFGSVNLNFN